MRSGRLIVSLLVALAACQPSKPDYPSDAVETFVNACIAAAPDNPGQKATCSCVFDKIQKKYSFKEYSAIDAGQAPDDWPPFRLASVAACQPSKPDYPSDAVETFVNACIAAAPDTPGQKATCSCLFDKIQKKYSFKEYSAIDAGQAPDDWPPFMLASAAACQPSKPDYPSDAVETFVNACIAAAPDTPGQKATCSCLFDKIQKKYSFKEYSAIDAGQAPDDWPPFMAASMTECVGK